MQPRIRGVLAALPVLIALAITPAASATCGLIDGSIPGGKTWYGATDPPPTLLFDLADDEGSSRDYANQLTGIYLVATQAGTFGWTLTPAWSTYASGTNTVRAALFCRAGTDIKSIIVRYDPGAPVASWSAPAASQWVRGSVPVQLVGSDAISGVDHYELALGAITVTSSDGSATFDTSEIADGARLLTGTSIDRAGNRSALATRTLRIDNGAPVVSLDSPSAAAVVTSTALSLAASASDAQSGVAQVSFELRPASGGSWQALGSDGDAPYRLASSAPLSDGAYDVRAVATDALGNVAATAKTAIVIARTAAPVLAGLPAIGTTLVPAAASAPAPAATAPAAVHRVKRKAVALRARVAPRRVESGHSFVLQGVAAGIARGVVVVTLQNVLRPGLVQQVRTTTRANGSFRVSIRPRFSGRVRVRYAGDATHRPATAEAGPVGVHPRLVATITATRAADGSLIDPHVRGRLLPAGGPVRLVWQARPANGGAWLLFCRSKDQISVGRNGVINGVCHVSGLHADNRYRLVVVATAGGSYLGAASKALVARPTR